MSAATADDRAESIRMIRDSAAAVAPPGADLGRIRALRFTDPGFDRAVLVQMGEMGWLGLRLPEAQGGAALGLGEACALAEELGAALVPEPLVAAMLSAAVLSAAGAAHRCRVLGCRLEDCDDLRPETFQAVVALNVLHLVSPPDQDLLLGQLAAAVAPGGTLLISAYSDDPDPTTDALLLQVARSRLLQLGTDPLIVERLLASRGASVFAVAMPRLDRVLSAAGLDAPRCLLQALATRLWLSRRLA